MAWPQVEVERSALFECRSVALLEIANSDVGELGAEGFPARFGQRE
jgi:hypothetical protein